MTYTDPKKCINILRLLWTKINELMNMTVEKKIFETC